jgi:hypothetical protein
MDHIANGKHAVGSQHTNGYSTLDNENEVNIHEKENTVFLVTQLGTTYRVIQSVTPIS